MGVDDTAELGCHLDLATQEGIVTAIDSAADDVIGAGYYDWGHSEQWEVECGRLERVWDVECGR